EAKVAPPTGTPPDDASATGKRTDPPRVAKTTGPAQEAKVVPPTGTPPDDASATGKRTDPPRVAKTTPPSVDPKAAVSPPSSKSSTSAGPAPAGAPGARALFDRGMEGWDKGGGGQGAAGCGGPGPQCARGAPRGLRAVPDRRGVLCGA